MSAFIVRRLGAGLIVIFIVLTMIFFLIRLSGDPTALMLSPEATHEQYLAMRHSLGFDRPLIVQYGDFIAGVAHGDFGDSLRHNRPAMEMILERAPATLELALVAIVLAVIIAIPVGVIAASRRNSAIDQISRTLAVIGQCSPVFWLGILLIVLFSVKLKILPAFGRGTWKHLVMPGLTLALYSVPVTMRMLRSSLIEVLSTDYIRTARAKGLSERVILYKHAIRNALIPVLTVFSLRMRVILGGAVITEQVFGYPGMGRLVLQAINYRDYAVLQAFVAVIAVVIVGLNLLVDISYAMIDPRVRLTGKK